MISSQILADSINPAGVRLTSWLLTYPRFIHSEMMTHRVYSRNAASSRAIPFHKLIDSIKSNPAYPERWGAEQKGMQSGDEVSNPEEAAMIWRMARDKAIDCAMTLAVLGLHKGIVNRLVEPFAHMTAIFTTTDHRNFFALRCHKDADKTFQSLAFGMLGKYISNQPREVPVGGWHIPRFPNTPGEADYGLSLEDMSLPKVATARCARLSYLTHEGEHSREKDVQKHDDLKRDGHWSPFEHCAKAVEIAYPLSNFDSTGVADDGLSYWMQYRKFFPDENRTCFDFEGVYNDRPEWLR